jgi:hypothetical protein
MDCTHVQEHLLNTRWNECSEEIPEVLAGFFTGRVHPDVRFEIFISMAVTNAASCGL